jgi:hypothetical protein
MTPEQIMALIGTIIGAPLLIEMVKRWFETKNLTLQSADKKEGMRDDREWTALEAALNREREVYANLLTFERAQFASRLSDIEARLGKIQEDALSYQKAYWEERLQRERLQGRVEYLEKELVKRSDCGRTD